MLNEPTIEKLRALRLAVMADAWLEQNKEAKVSSLLSTNDSDCLSTPNTSPATTGD